MPDPTHPNAPAPHGDHGLGAAEREAWRVDGFFFREAVFGAEELAAMRRAGERVVAIASDAVRRGGEAYAIDGNRYHEAGGATVQFEHRDGSDTIRVVEPFHHLDPLFDRLIDDPRITVPMRDLIGTDGIALYTDKINLKRPREGSRFQWHQDSPYWSHFTQDLDRLPNVMVTLDDAHAGNGCFRVIRGSHTRGMLPGLEGEGTLGPLFTDPAGFDLEDQVLAEVPAGSLVFFSPHTVHGSEPNHSDELRRAMVLTYQPGGRRMFKVDAKRDVVFR